MKFEIRDEKVMVLLRKGGEWRNVYNDGVGSHKGFGGCRYYYVYAPSSTHYPYQSIIGKKRIDELDRLFAQLEEERQR